jgi:hypothetical protein
VGNVQHQGNSPATLASTTTTTTTTATAAMAAVELPPPLIPERRPREHDIIDVDSLDDDQFRASGYPFQRRRHEQGSTITHAIVVSDSDDEGPGGSRRTVNSGRLRRRRPSTCFSQSLQHAANIHEEPSRSIFSPPPPPQDTSIPPVPPLPSYVPMHRRPPPFPSVVRPIAQPFPFEANIQQVNPTQHALPSAPPSHHRPSMGLGGALITLNRENAEARARRNPFEPRARRLPDRRPVGRGAAFLSNLPNFMQSIVQRMTSHPPQTAADDEDILAILAAEEAEEREQDEDDEFMRRVMRGGGHYGHMVFGGPPPRREDMDYKPSYTHPGKPAPGYTFDFTSSSPSSPSSSQSSSSSSSSSSAETTLICAKCLDPLVMGGSDLNWKERKVWGLRCGHLLDGKCLEELMKPAGEKVEDVQDGKGKEKALETEDNPIRSRLRPRHSDVAAATLSSPVTPIPIRSRPRPRPRPRARRRAKRAPQAFHEWTCPVPGCGKVHISVKNDGVWGADAEKGAVGVFV